MGDDVVLDVRGLTRRFKGADGVGNVSLSVRAGERVALLGHNGAGKSTLMKVILGLLPIDSGTALIAGHEVGSTAARAAVAYLPEAVSFHPALTGREQLRLFAKLARVERSEADALLERVGLEHAAERRIGTYSKGMRQRLGMAQVFLGKPALALLDEPTSGLDPIARHDLYALIDALAAQGTGVMIASHALTEIEARTDRIAILRGGQLVADAPLQELFARANMPIRFRLSAQADATALFDRFGGQRINGARVEFNVTPDQKMARLADVTAMGAQVADVEIIPPSLEDLYRYYSKPAEAS
ncbi:ABC transporter ATP-binding protein [Roseobacter denitrificans]|uniref:Copper transport ATP-binding protein NosF n=1 Tax=Roseobacter denitrificans (strain ATCC 33942 / OCh 114) TaxID=375451 RepID=Q16A15_ROSDO|nr:ABC transporter ATP-binding protein [Roseobacter denitrificans]ABG31178.1 copper transport ATP-binding protein NosF [Roseobacter denitrificans OCh 114]AVL54237.1 ABC transporter ATP-binding protein [Roseobacter denitrificans]SFF97634.1 Cu-processing system ATP-binding protein [Roseobacter denitrificans OCh 114]